MDEPFDEIEPLQDIGQLLKDIEQHLEDERRGTDPGDGPPDGSPVPASRPIPPQRSGGNQNPLPPAPKRPETT